MNSIRLSSAFALSLLIAAPSTLSAQESKEVKRIRCADVLVQRALGNDTSPDGCIPGGPLDERAVRRSIALNEALGITALIRGQIADSRDWVSIIHGSTLTECLESTVSALGICEGDWGCDESLENRMLQCVAETPTPDTVEGCAEVAERVDSVCLQTNVIGDKCESTTENRMLQCVAETPTPDTVEGCAEVAKRVDSVCHQTNVIGDKCESTTENRMLQCVANKDGAF